MTENKISREIKNMVNNDDVVLFMKGDPDFPQCGFSANAVGILNYFKINFKSYNVLESVELRQGIKDFSNWPTVPQIFIKGEFIGGSDILKEIAENGEIDKILEEKKISFLAPER